MTGTSSEWPCAGRTDVGRVRAQNEDAYHLLGGVWMVADGLGGHAGGDVASATAVEAAAAALGTRAGAGDRVGAAEQVLTDVFAAAHQAVRVAGQARGELSSMGTTLVVAVATGAGVQVGTLGDSRAYLLTDAGIRQLTRDDNYAEELLAAGVITAEQARTHSGQYVLTRALLADEPEAGPPHVVTVHGPGRLLLCTDGLTSELDDDEVRTLLAEGDVETAAEALVNAAVQAGGRDNVTVVVVDLPDE